MSVIQQKNDGSPMKRGISRRWVKVDSFKIYFGGQIVLGVGGLKLKKGEEIKNDLQIFGMGS